MPIYASFKRRASAAEVRCNPAKAALICKIAWYFNYLRLPWREAGEPRPFLSGHFYGNNLQLP